MEPFAKLSDLFLGLTLAAEPQDEVMEGPQGLDSAWVREMFGDPAEVEGMVLADMQTRIGLAVKASAKRSPLAVKVISDTVMGRGSQVWLWMAGLVSDQEELSPEQVRELTAWAKTVGAEDIAALVASEISVPEGPHEVVVTYDLVEQETQKVARGLRETLEREAFRWGALRPVSIGNTPAVGRGGFRSRGVGIFATDRLSILADTVAKKWEAYLRAAAWGDFYVASREAYLDPDDALRAVGGQGEAGRRMAVVLGTIAHYDKGLGRKLFGGKGLPVWEHAVAKSLVLNAKEDTAPGRDEELLFARVRKAAGEIYLAALHREGPLVGKPGEGWEFEAKVAGAIIGGNCRRVSGGVRKRLQEIAKEIPSTVSRDEWLKGKVFSLPVTDQHKLCGSVIDDAKRVGELQLKDGLPRMRVRDGKRFIRVELAA
jgi:hypothetical protein